MRLLVVNPNASEGVTARIRAAAAAAALDGERVDTVTAPSDVPLIVTAEDAARASGAVEAAIAERARDYDAAVVASFGDTGLAKARAGAAIPVIGIARAAFLSALAVADDFAIVTFSPAMTPGFHAILDDYRLRDRLRRVYAVDAATPDDPGAVQDRLRPALLAACLSAARDGAAAVVLGGGPLAGLAARLRPHSPVPLFDGVEAAVAMARLAVASAGPSRIAARAPA